MRLTGGVFLAFLNLGPLVSCSNVVSKHQTYKATMVRERSGKIEYTVVTVTGKNMAVAQPVIDTFPEGEDEFYRAGRKGVDAGVMTGGSHPVEPAKVKLTERWQQLGDTTLAVDE